MFAAAAPQEDLNKAAQASVMFEDMGAILFAAEALDRWRRTLPSAAGLRLWATEASARADRLLERCCEGASIPWLATPSGAAHPRIANGEVAFLAAQQLTSSDIAERPFVSVRTVDNHLQQVYAKLGYQAAQRAGQSFPSS